MVRIVPLILILLLLPGSASAKLDVALCGSYPERSQEELALHRKSRQARRGQTALAAGVPSTNRDIGHIAVVEDAGGVISRRNSFDLDGQTLTFRPADAAATRYRFETGPASFDDQAVADGELIEDFADDDFRRFPAPFPLRFFGRVHQSVFVNSDGNLTLEESDTSTAGRSLGRVTAGPPRLAALFRDLDPSRALDGVRVLSQPTRMVVSWVDVPEFSDFGFGAPRQTFQVRLYADGRIEFAYRSITTLSAVVGIAPGGLQGSSEVVSFSSGSDAEFDAAVVERFTNMLEVDTVLTAQRFYETHDDSYDYLVMFNSLGISAGAGAVAFEQTLRNHRTGFGDLLVDFGADYGSPRRLQAIMNMGPLRQYPTDPNALLPSRGLTGDTPLTVLGHEAGHLFLAFASVRDPRNPDATPMLGRDGAHWNFSFNSEASLLEGNRICDRDRETCPQTPGLGRFVTVATVEGYSPLDQYLMGFRPPSEVPPTFLVEASTAGSSGRRPRVGVTFDGRRRDIHVDELIEAEGRRTPDHTVAQRVFRLAFILVVAADSEPAAEVIEQVDRYRREFEDFYRQASGERAFAETSLQSELRLSTFPGSGVVLGGTLRARVAVAAPVEGDLEILLSSENGAAGVPASVTIPMGAASTEFDIAGLRAGPDRLVAEVPGSVYTRATSPLQVLGDSSGLRLTIVSGNAQPATPGQALPEPVVVRVSDINNLPYPGVRVTATLAGGGSATPAEADSNERGEAQFIWTPGPDPLNELTASVAGSSPVVSVTVTATGLPFVAAGGVVDAASFRAPISPGALATIFGANLAAGSSGQAATAVPTRLAGVRVLVDGRAAGLLYVSDRQINFLVPPGVPFGEVDIIVSTPLGQSAVRATVAAVSPGIFVMPDGFGAVTLAGTRQLTSERPVAAGEFIQMFCTGLGQTRLNPSNGLQETVDSPQVFIGGIASQIQFSGLAPSFPGLNQVNARVPAGLKPGSQTLELVIGGVAANRVTIVVR